MACARVKMASLKESRARYRVSCHMKRVLLVEARVMPKYHALSAWRRKAHAASGRTVRGSVMLNMMVLMGFVN